MSILQIEILEANISALAAENEALRNDAREMAKVVLNQHGRCKTPMKWQRDLLVIARKYQTGGE